MIIARGTTPTVVCKIPDSTSLDDISEIWFSITQNGKLVVDKIYTNGDVFIDQEQHTIAASLTQTETLKLTNTEPRPFFGLRILYSDGHVIASRTKKSSIVFVQEIAKEGIIA